MKRPKGEQAEFTFQRMCEFFKAHNIRPQVGFGMVRDFISDHFDWVGKDPASSMAEWISSMSLACDKGSNRDVMTSPDGPFYLCTECKGVGLIPPFPRIAGYEDACSNCDGQGVLSNDAEGYTEF